MITQENELRFLQPVERIPSPKRKKRSVYDEIIMEFLKLNLKYAEVKNVNKAPQTIYMMINLRLKKMQLENIKVRVRNGKIYLEKVETKTTTKCDKEPVFKPTTLAEFQQESTSPSKPIIDVTHLLNTFIIKLKCPKCKALNSKEARFCRECSYSFYKDENEYRSSLELLEKLERKMNSGKLQNEKTPGAS